MFKFLREAATKASLANLNRSVEVLILQCGQGAPNDKILGHLKSMLMDANLAIQNSKKTDKPIVGEDIVQICNGLIAQQGLQIGAAQGALSAFYTEIRKVN